jgi:Amt family ammonium transporter
MYHNPIKNILLFRLILGLFLLLFNTYYVAAVEPQTTTTNAKDELSTQNVTNNSTVDKNVQDIDTTEAEMQKIEAQKVLTLEKINLITTALESLQSEIQNSQQSTSLNSDKVNSMKESFAAIEKKLEEVFVILNISKDFTTANTDAIKENKKELSNLLRSTRTSISDISLQKSLIEDNSIRLYEILVKIDSISEKLRKISRNQSDNQENNIDKDNVNTASNDSLNKVWILFSIILISLAPIAFILSSDDNKYHHLKDGTPHRQGIILVSLGVFLGYFLVGFGIMYGESLGGWIGVSSYVLESPAVLMAIPSSFPFYEILLYQVGFSVLASLIIYTAIGRLLSATSHMLLSLFTGGILIPIFAHWVWAEQFITGNKGWLAAIGFVDQSGSTVIHTVAAFFSLMVIIQLGKVDKPLTSPLRIIGDFPVYSSSATLFLWIAWQGLTTGILTVDDGQISQTMLNNGLAASSAGIMAFMHYVFFHPGKGKISRGLSGVITGLVAISACASSVTAMEAIVIGMIAGILQNLSFAFLHKYLLKKDFQIPASYLISIHGIGGVWGALCVGLLGTEGSFFAPNTIQIAAQIQGIIAAIIYSMVLGYIVAMFFTSLEKKRQRKLEEKEKLLLAHT